MPLEHAAHILSDDPRMRAVAAVSGLLKYAKSRLIPERWATFQAWCVLHGLPQSPIGILNHTKPSVAIDAMWSLIWGLLTPVQQSTIYGYSLRFSGNTTLATSAFTVAGAVLCTSLTASGSGPHTLGDVAANGLEATTSASVAGSVTSGGYLIVGVASPPADVGAAVAAMTRAAELRLTRTMTRKEADDYRFSVGSTILFEDPSADLRVVKFNALGTTGDDEVVLGGPSFDSGWMTMAAHSVGDVAVNPPYELTYDLNVQMPASEPGELASLLDFQVFSRHGVLVDASGPHALPPGTFGFDTNPGVPWYGTDLPLTPGTAGVQLMIDSAGGLRLRVGVQSLRHAVKALVLDLRVFGWFRGIG